MTSGCLIGVLTLLLFSGVRRDGGDWKTLKVGNFAVSKTKDKNLFDVSFKSKTVTQISSVNIRCRPVTIRNSIILPVFEQLLCINDKGQKVWAKDLDYFYNPTNMVASGNIVVEDEGPLTSGKRDEGESDRDWYLSIEKSRRTFGILSVDR